MGVSVRERGQRGDSALREVKLLAKRREHHEYLIAGRAPSKEDFLRYLQLEMNLEALLKLRSKSEKKAKVNAAVVAVRRRVHYIFDRSCRRFKDDEVMWLQWSEYADRTGAHTKLARVFAPHNELLCDFVGRRFDWPAR